MGKPIEGCPGEPLTAEHFGPILEWQVRRDNEALAFVGGADDAEQQLGSRLADRYVTQL